MHDIVISCRTCVGKLVPLSTPSYVYNTLLRLHVGQSKCSDFSAVRRAAKQSQKSSCCHLWFSDIHSSGSPTTAQTLQFTGSNLSRSISTALLVESQQPVSSLISRCAIPKSCNSFKAHTTEETKGSKSCFACSFSARKRFEEVRGGSLQLNHPDLV